MAQEKRQRDLGADNRRKAGGQGGSRAGGKGGGSRNARQNAKELLAAQRRAEARRRAFIGASIALVVVLVVVGVFIGLKTSNHKATPSAGTAPTPASSALVSQVTAVPPATLDTIGKGAGVTGPTATTGQAVKTADGKPLVFYYGAEFCPFCAAERWPLIVALSRFGTFTGLQSIYSSEDNIPTWTFEGSTYSSPYLTFQPQEVEDQNGQPLDTLTADQQAIVNQFNPGKTFPFVSLGNQAIVPNASYDNSLLSGKTPDQVGAALQDPNSDIAKAIGGSANALTAQICKLTDNQPSDVCSSKAVQAWSAGG